MVRPHLGKERDSDDRVHYGFQYLIAGVMLASPVFAQNEALRGKMAMSVYVSIYGGGDRRTPPSCGCLSSSSCTTSGIAVLPHASPPNFPVLNLTIDVPPGHPSARSHQHAVTAA